MGRKDLKTIVNQLHSIYSKLDYDVKHDIILSQTLIQLNIAIGNEEDIDVYVSNLKIMKKSAVAWREYDNG